MGRRDCKWPCIFFCHFPGLGDLQWRVTGVTLLSLCFWTSRSWCFSLWCFRMPLFCQQPQPAQLSCGWEGIRREKPSCLSSSAEACHEDECGDHQWNRDELAQLTVQTYRTVSRSRKTPTHNNEAKVELAYSAERLVSTTY